MSSDIHLSKNLKLKIESKLEELANLIYSFDYVSTQNIGYLTGMAGMLPFLFEYAQFSGNKKFIDLAEKYLYDLVHKMQEPIYTSTFSNGYCGIGWVFEFLSLNGYIEPIEVLYPYDEMLADQALKEIDRKNWDPLHGSVGMGFYLLKRKENPYIKQKLQLLIEKISQLTVQDGNGLKLKNLEDRINLGLAHGIPGLMVFLCRCIELNVAKEQSFELLLGLSSYFKRQKKDVMAKGYYYPSAEGGRDTGPRLAWCYGDLGIVTSLIYVGKILGGYQVQINEMIKHILKRQSPNESGIFGAGICHGSAGVILILNHFYNMGYFNDVTPLEFWSEQSLSMASYDDGYAGFKKFRTSKAGGPIKEIGLLEGITGIASVYLSLLNGKLNWSEGLMIFKGHQFDLTNANT